MRRREFITITSVAAAFPMLARAQQAERMRRIGVLMAGSADADGQARVAAFRQGLQEFGWQEGRNVVIELKWGGGGSDGIRVAAAELVGLKPDVLLVNGGRGVIALQQETHVIPIIFSGATDPVEDGLVASLSRPGGNVTGFANAEGTMIGKYVGLLKQLAPRLERVAILSGLGASFSPERSRIMADAARSLGIRSELMGFEDAPDIERAFATFAREPNGGLVLPGDGNIVVHRDLIIALAARHRLPAIYPFKIMANVGGLASYGADILDVTRRAASYADRILKGEKPGALPVQLPTKFEFVINLRTAKALGLEIPPALLAIADEVIE